MPTNNGSRLVSIVSDKSRCLQHIPISSFAHFLICTIVGVDEPEPVGLVGHAHVVRPVVGARTAGTVLRGNFKDDLLVMRRHFGSRFVSLGVGLKIGWNIRLSDFTAQVMDALL